MTRKIILAVAIGIGVGYFIPSGCILPYTDIIIDIGLCFLLFFVGMDIGKNKEVLNKIRRIGFRILLIPIMIITGSIGGSIFAGYLLGLPLNESGAVGAGLGWYSLSAMILANYSAKLSALAFISNVTREIIALTTIPFIAKYIGDLESVAPAGATSMDTLLPVISNATNPQTTIIAFINGVILSIAVPFLVSFMIKI
ncbi:lysine exporter LysO family protein [Caloranaerobacter azorensis]|uniref:Lysine exporter LysO family protein n=1 Tax=Caloranaerobacter azorensis TaxID=116090 RepID=A0A6P1YE42_9FIRM|nr:lysine exporter LysO family protein [Caloranaerobacter azorensis]QIB27033.1 lysine exporter LysO family protein [Caloranaerobacter azorensis]